MGWGPGLDGPTPPAPNPYPSCVWLENFCFLVFFLNKKDSTNNNNKKKFRQGFAGVSAAAGQD